MRFKQTHAKRLNITDNSGDVVLDINTDLSFNIPRSESNLTEVLHPDISNNTIFHDSGIVLSINEPTPTTIELDRSSQKTNDSSSASDDFSQI